MDEGNQGAADERGRTRRIWSWIWGTSDQPDPLQAESRRRRWLARGLLLVLLALVTWVNGSYVLRNPFPPWSQHRGYMMVPRMVRYFQGWEQPPVVDHLDASGKGYALPRRDPLPWGDPLTLAREFAPEGRLRLAVKDCGQGFYTCMPHSFSACAMLGVLVPGTSWLPTMGMTFYLLLLIAAAYGIGAEARGRAVGVAAAAIAASYPGLIGFSRFVEGYLPATALSVAMVYCLVRSRGMTRWLPCVAFVPLAFMAIRNGEGLSEGIGAGLAVAGPFVVAFVGGVFDALRRRRPPLRPLVGLALIAAPLLLTMDWPWLALALPHTTDGFDEWYQNTQPGDPAASDTTRYLFAYGGYLILVYSQYLKPLMTLWLLAALPLFLLRPARHKWTLLLWFVVPASAFAVMPRKALWYALPMVPPLAVITAVGLSQLKRCAWRRGALIAASLVGLIQMVGFFSMAPIQISRTGWLAEPLPRGFIVAREVNFFQPFAGETGPLIATTERFLAYLDENVPRDDQLKHVAAVTEWGRDIYAAQVFAYVVNLRRPDIEVVPLCEPHFLNLESFAGLAPRDFAFYLQFRDNRLASCCDEQGMALVHRPENQVLPPRDLQRFADRLVRSSRGVVPEMPDVLVLGHPAVAHLDTESPVGTSP